MQTNSCVCVYLETIMLHQGQLQHSVHPMWHNASELHDIVRASVCVYVYVCVWV